MKAIVNTGPNQLEMLELPIPEPGPGQVRIRTSACGICATELSMIAGWKRTGFPAIPGHEWSGVIDKVGQNADCKLPGKNCVAENVLTDGSEVGFEHPGGYAEYFLTEAANIHILPDNFDMDKAALIEPLAVSIRGFRKLSPVINEPVLIFGDGPIGLLLFMLILMKTESVALVGGSQYKLNLAKILGASAVFDYKSSGRNLKETIAQELHSSFPVIIDASGSPIAFETAFNLASQCGKILILSDYGEDTKAEFRWQDMLHKELRIIGSNASAGAWSEAVRLVVNNLLPIESLITHRFPVSEYEKAFDIIRNNKDETVKVILQW